MLIRLSYVAAAWHVGRSGAGWLYDPSSGSYIDAMRR